MPGFFEIVQPAATTPTRLYETGKRAAILRTINVCNTDASARDISIFISREGISDIETAIYYTHSLATITTLYRDNMNLYLPPGTAITVQASVADKVTFLVAGDVL